MFYFCRPISLRKRNPNSQPNLQRERKTKYLSLFSLVRMNLRLVWWRLKNRNGSWSKGKKWRLKVRIKEHRWSAMNLFTCSRARILGKSGRDWDSEIESWLEECIIFSCPCLTVNLARFCVEENSVPSRGTNQTVEKYWLSSSWSNVEE